MPDRYCVAHFANTIIGRPGNIGVRTAKIIQLHAQQGGRGYCLCRRTDTRVKAYQYLDMGLLGHAPRLLNAANIYINNGFDHRKWDLRLFGLHSNRHLPRLMKQGVDVAHMWDICTDTMAKLTAKNIPVVLDIPVAPFSYVKRLHEAGLGASLNFFQRQMEEEQRAYALADLIIAPSDFVSRELQMGGVSENKIRIVEFGTAVPKLTRTPRADKATLNFAFVGIVNQRKGINELLQAWKDPIFQNDRLHLCGRLTPAVIKQLPESHPASIIAPGFINPFQYLLDCDVFVFPSWSEGSSKAIYEAMACGLPVITTRSSGSIVRHGVDGFVIDAGDVTSLRDCMRWFKEHPEQIALMGESARAHAKAYTWERYAQKVIDIYTEVIQRC